MNIRYRFTVAAVSLAAISLSACSETGNTQALSKESLGEELFNDISLSKDGTQSCASCHDSEHAFIDPRLNVTSIDSVTTGAVSTGQDGISLGDINTPSAAYTAFVPDFHFDQEEGLYKGGVFLDGRAGNLAEQAGMPFLNPVEMQSSKEAVVAVVQHRYADSMQAVYGDDIFSDSEQAFDAIADAIAAHEKTEQFASFDSKFDKVQKGQASFTEDEKKGLDLFTAEDKGNCVACHPVPDANSSKTESLFTDFTYDNLGAPANTLVRSRNGKEPGFIDAGLFNNPLVDDPELTGAFRVSSLRNVAVTAPYMHNGVFRDLRTTVEFYNSRDVEGALNPETGLAWRQAEVDGTKNTEELGNLGLSKEEIDSIVVFLKTLTDERYEHLLQ